MHLAFETKELRAQCESRVAAEQKWGEVVAVQLRRRLADIFAAPTPLDLPQSKLSYRGSGKDEQLVLQLAEGVCLVVAPNLTGGSLPNQKVPWERIARVKIVSVEDCRD